MVVDYYQRTFSSTGKAFRKNFSLGAEGEDMRILTLKTRAIALSQVL